MPPAIESEPSVTASGTGAVDELGRGVQVDHPEQPGDRSPAEGRRLDVTQLRDRERTVRADGPAPEEHLRLGDDLAPRLEHVGDQHL